MRILAEIFSVENGNRILNTPTDFVLIPRFWLGWDFPVPFSSLVAARSKPQYPLPFLFTSSVKTLALHLPSEKFPIRLTGTVFFPLIYSLLPPLLVLLSSYPLVRPADLLHDLLSSSPPVAPPFSVLLHHRSVTDEARLRSCFKDLLVPLLLFCQFILFAESYFYPPAQLTRSCNEHGLIRLFLVILVIE